MADQPAEVIVIGGGAAGLAAADVLSSRGKRVLLLEGRARLGGRIETRHDPAWPLPIERGAEFIHGKPEETWAIVRAGGGGGAGKGSLYDISDEHWVHGHGRLSKPAGFFEEVEKVLELVSKVGSNRNLGDMSFDECMKRYGKRVKPEVRQWTRMFVEGFNAADAREVSCAWLAEAQEASDEIEGDRLFRVYAGYDRIIQFMRTGLQETVQVELSSVVKRISWGEADEGGKVMVEAEIGEGEGLVSRTFVAEEVVVTVPLGVLQARPGEEGAIVFDPGLPAEKLEALSKLRMGAVVKVIMRFREAFWEKKVPELDFVHGAGKFPTWWTTLPIRTSVLTAWAGGPAADALSGKSEDEILGEATGCLAKYLGMNRRNVESKLVGAHVCDWRRKPLSRGAYSYAAVGGAKAARMLARPVGGRLYFAGEATHEGMSGTVAGAIASGRRAAGEVLRKGGRAATIRRK